MCSGERCINFCVFSLDRTAKLRECESCSTEFEVELPNDVILWRWYRETRLVEAAVPWMLNEEIEEEFTWWELSAGFWVQCAIERTLGALLRSVVLLGWELDTRARELGSGGMEDDPDGVE